MKSVVVNGSVAVSLCLLLCLLGGARPTRAQGYGSNTGQGYGGQMGPASGGPAGASSKKLGAPVTVLPAGTVFAVEMKQPFRIAQTRKGDRILLDVLEVNPRQRDSVPGQVASLPIRSNVSLGLPRGCQISGQIAGIQEMVVQGKTQRSAILLLDQLIGRDGKVRPFLGAISVSDDPSNLPRWLDERKYENKDHASSAESMAVVIPWAADLGPIGIGAAVFFTRKYQKMKMERLALKDATQAAVTIIDGDIEPVVDKGKTVYPWFYVISTYRTQYAE